MSMRANAVRRVLKLVSQQPERLFKQSFIDWNEVYDCTVYYSTFDMSRIIGQNDEIMSPIGPYSIAFCRFTCTLLLKTERMAGSGYTPPPRAGPAGVNVGGGSSMGRAIFALCGGLAGAYYGFYLQSKYIEERRVPSVHFG